MFEKINQMFKKHSRNGFEKLRAHTFWSEKKFYHKNSSRRTTRPWKPTKLTENSENFDTKSTIFMVLNIIKKFLDQMVTWDFHF